MSSKKKITIAALVGAVLIALLVGGIIALTTAKIPDDPEAARAFFFALTNGTLTSEDLANEKDSRDYTPTRMTQIVGENLYAASQKQTARDIYKLAKEEGARFGFRKPTDTNYGLNAFYAEHAFFITMEEEVVSKSFTEQSYPVMVSDGIIYVAEKGVLYKLAVSQPDAFIAEMISDYVDYDKDVRAKVIPARRSSITADDTMEAFIGLNLWGKKSVWNFLTNGLGNWTPKTSDAECQENAVIVAYDNPPWNVDGIWYVGNKEFGKVNEGAEMINFWFPELPMSETLQLSDRILLGSPEYLRRQGIMLFPKLSDAVKANLGGGDGNGTTTRATTPYNPNPNPNPTTTTPAPTPAPTTTTTPKPAVTTAPTTTTPKATTTTAVTTAPKKTISSISVTPASWELEQGESMLFEAIAYYNDGTREDVTYAATWKTNVGANYGVSMSGNILMAADNATPMSDVAVWAEWDGKRSNYAMGDIIGVEEEDLITLNPTLVNISYTGGSATFILDATQPWAVSDWHGGFAGTLSHLQGAAGQHRLTVTLPANDRAVVRTWFITFKTSGGATATLTVSQGLNPGGTPSQIDPADPIPGGTFQPEYGYDGNNDGTPDPINNPDPGTPSYHTDHPEHNPNDPANPGQTVIPDPVPAPPTDSTITDRPGNGDDN